MIMQFIATVTNNVNDEPYSIYKIMQYKEGRYKYTEKQLLRIINHINTGVIDTFDV